jgi:hypothetical protein
MRWDAKTLVLMQLLLAAICALWFRPPPTPPIDQREGLPLEASVFLKNADLFELLTLDPGGDGQALDDRNRLRETVERFAVIGKSEIVDASTRNVLIDAIDRSVREAKSQESSSFYPKYAIRAGYGNQVVAVIISFDGGQFDLISHGEIRHGSLSASARKFFDALVSARGLAMMPQANAGR